MPVMDEFKELQEGEMEVLRSIYGDDFESVETRTAWKSVNAAHEFRVRVRPVEEPLKEIVNVKIHFKLPLKYPKQAPTFTLDEPVGLETNHLNALNTHRRQRTLLQRESTTTLLGSEMIYELCSIAATFITDRHTDMNKNSLEDQRKLRSQEEEKANREALERAEAQKQREQAAEAARMAQLISGDVKRKEELRAERDRQEKLKEREGIEGESLQVGEGGERKVKMLISTDGHGTKEVVAKLGMPSGTDWIGRMLPVELMMGMEAALSANAYVIDVLGPYYLTPQGKRKLSKVDTDLTRARALRHPNILSLYGSVLARYTPSFFPDNPSAQPLLRTTAGWSLIVLHEQVPTAAQTLEYLLATVGELKLEKAITCLQQLVAAVEYLHLSNVTHRSIRPKAIWVCNERSPVGNSTVSIRLGDVAWFQRIIDLNKAEPWVAAPSQDDLPESWMCPEVVDDPFAYDRSRDMWDVGIVFAQMVFGTDVHRRYASPADLLQSIPRNSSPVLRKVLSDLLLTEAKKRPTAARLSAQLLELSVSGGAHDSGVSLTPMILSTTPTNNVAAWPNKVRGAGTPMFSPGVGSRESQMAESSQVGFFWQPRPTGSRYRSEFEELEFLGRGGGGQVVKARNRLDGHLYAVKKIRLPTDKQAEIKILREVTIWSRMNHPNIVRYHTAWTETEDVSQSSYVIDGEGSTQPTADISAPSTESVSTANEATGDSNSDDDSDPVDFDSDDDDAAATPGHELDIDLGLDDLDDVDFLSAGHSKSVSYPSIHFGNEDNASTDGRISPAVSRHSKHSTRYNSPVILATPKQTRTLYIQMEYVEKLTLREAIEEGLSEIASWRFMNQILSAMLHFTSLNIIHRDLKPSNIFIDGKEDVRIGDFGLAVNQGGVLDPTDGLLSMDSSMDESDFTSGVGTSLYIAPETLSRTRTERSIKYSNKIDSEFREDVRRPVLRDSFTCYREPTVYSLGVVFFEMFHGPFKTGMERIHVLRRLREPEIRFPPSWDMVRLARHTKIVQTCLQHDPEKRASPKDLLASDLLPPRVGDDSIEETIRLLSHSGTTHAQTLITALFNQTVEDRIRKDFSYDFYDGEGAKVDNDPYAELVRDKLSRIFRQKGAVSMDSPLLMPHSNIYGARDPVRLLDSDGTVACLPFHLNIPFCRMVARDTSLTRLKRWTIAPVYRHTKAGGQPRAVLNAAFDIVTDAVTAATEAEILIVVEEILAAFPLTGQKVHVLNHSKLLDAVVDRVPEKQREAVLEVLQQHGRLQRSWVKTSSELLKIPGVTKAMCDEFGLLNTSGTLAEIRSLVVDSPRLKHVVQEGFDELQEILNFSQQLGIKNIKISPLLATNWDFHRDGVLFETHHIRGKMREVVAAGGRFDEVVSRLAAPEVRYSGRVPHVVGVSISVAKLSQAAADANAAASKSLMNRRDESTRSYGPWSVRRCDVYVVSFVANLIEARWDVVKDLWKAGIKADLMYDDNFLSLTPEQLQSACRREGVMWIVIVKPGQAATAHGRHALDDAERTLKVKSVLLPRSELTSFLSKEMREQQIADESSNEAFDAVGSLAEQAKSLQNIYPILADDDVRQKGRAKQKSMIASRAQKSVEQAAQAAAEAPVFAVDVDGQAYRKMCESAAWVDDDEAYRSVIQHAPNTKRDYIASIRQQIRKHKAASSTPLPSFWLFSLREDRSVLLTCDGV
ncbi:BQ5605_C013g07278 [Microbotryum silenes-dioicae]|uniref:non-specific serine/threonine protein kinase n=1 Tax=Microbotryum silenes-dioicae TaxID=796604 RepID=A0A2X0NVL6_9BASI|nr:BQ5605_C013g07278 [Microbotryum silenes-dioicae]